jgi:hypothetical protein
MTKPVVVRISRSMLSNALRAAADQYDADSKVYERGSPLALSFGVQSRTARRVADTIDQADTIELMD